MENIDENESEENQRVAFDTVVTGRNCVVTSDCHIYGCSSCVVASRSSEILSTKHHNIRTAPHLDVYQNCRTIPLQVFMNYL